MVQTWVRDRWYDHNCGKNHGIKFEPACNNRQHDPLKIHGNSSHCNMQTVLEVEYIAEGRKEVMYSEREMASCLSKEILATYTKTYKYARKLVLIHPL